MKKITLLLCMCMAAWCVPQRVWASDPTVSYDDAKKVLTITSDEAGKLTAAMVSSYTAATTIVLNGTFNSDDLAKISTDSGFNSVTLKVSVSGTTLTIQSSSAGDLKTFLQDNATSDQKTKMENCTTIVFKGMFNQDDLQKIQGINDGGYKNVTTVDMTNAKFGQSASSSNVYILFKTETNNAIGEEGNQAIIGGTLYQWQKTKQWNSLTSDKYPIEGESVTLYADESAMNAQKNVKSIGDYAKILGSPNYKYLKMTIYSDSWTSNSTTAPASFTPVGWLANDLDAKRYEYSNGQSIRMREYYRKQYWKRYYDDTEPTSVEDGPTVFIGNSYVVGGLTDANSNQILNTPGSTGDYIWFYAYYQKAYDGRWVRLTQYDNASSAPSYNIDRTGALRDEQIQQTSGSEGEILRVKEFYVKDGSFSWEKCYPTSSDLSGQTVYSGSEVGATYGSLDGNIGASGAYLWFYVYYTKSDSRAWTDERDTAPESPAVATDATFDYAYRNNHMAGYQNGQWVKMPNYAYYQLDLNGPEEWVQIDYTDGSTYSLTQMCASEATLTDGSHNGSATGQYAIVYSDANKRTRGATEWGSYNASAIVPDYGQMSFKYWAGTLTHATTSKYANASISNEIFQNCKKLETVNYLSGNVTGFGDHSISNGYNTSDNSTLTEPGLSVTIGKDVTQIDANAFMRCNVLKTLTFDKSYTEEEQNAAAAYYADKTKPVPTYPKELTIGDNAFKDCFNLTSVEIPNRVISLGNNAFEHVGNLTQTEAIQESTGTFSLTFERRNKTLDSSVSINYDHDLTIGNGCFNQCYNLETLSLPIRLSSLGSGAFTDTPNLQSLTIREEPTEDSRLKVIPSNAFLRSGIKSVTIPRSVLEIESGAFTECFNIETITFQETNDKVGDVQKPLIIRETAFAGGTESKYKLKKVIVNIHPATRLLVCEYNAFNFTSLVGQTDVESSQEAVLEFDDADWDYYQGNWKKGYAFSQSNLNLFKDGSTRGSAQATVGNNGLALTNEAKEPRNGWQQFAMSTLGVEVVIPQGNYLRTYSTKTPHYIPIIAGTTNTYLYDIYRISAFSDGWNSGDDVNDREKADQATRTATATQVTNEIGSRRYVPASTGLIMQIHGNSNDKYIVYQEEFSSSVEGYVYYPHETSTGNINFLWPSCDDETITVDNEKKVVINPTDPYPLSGSGERYRIFGLWVEDNAFWRSEPGVLINPDMAYLKLPVGVFRWANEGAGTTPNYTGAGARIALHFSDDESEVSGIGSVVNTFDSNDSYYTIQGVKVSQPQKKGLYIINGKKIFVK